MTTDADEFLARAGEFLYAERVRNTVLLTVTETIRSGAAVYGGGPAGPLLGWLEDGGQVLGAFLHTPPFPVTLTAMTAVAADALAAQLAAIDREVPGVNGDEGPAGAFAAAWQRERAGRRALPPRVHHRMRLYRLTDLAWPDPVPAGAARVAGVGDRDLLKDWWGGFAADTGTQMAAAGPAIDERLSYGGTTLWQVEGVPVAMASNTRTAAGMVRIAEVYTPRELRGRGYAGAVTASVSKAALDAGVLEVVLFTDLANPTSNELYRRLGFAPVEDRVVLTFG